MGRKSVKLGILTALLTVGVAQAAQANDIQRFKTVFATDVAYAGFGGLRDNGTGTLNLSGVSGHVTEAYLYWHGPTDSTDSSANATVKFKGANVTGTNIGVSSDNCWGFVNSQAYRANVTSLVTGNGGYSLANFTKDSNSVNVNGVSLVVFFQDSNSSNNRDVVMFNGNDSNTHNTFDADGWNVSLPGINYKSGNASMDMHVSDGQSFPDDAVKVNGTVIAPAGSVFDGNTVPGNPDTTHGGLLWDIRSFNVTSLLHPGSNTLTLTTGQNSDCLSLIMAAVNLPAGAAPNQPPPPPAPVPTPPARVQAKDSKAPRVSIAGVGRGCVRSAFSARIRVSESHLRRVSVYVDGKRVARTAKKRFKVRVHAAGMKAGRHRLRIVAVDRAGNRKVITQMFARCAQARPVVVPHFTG
jgi:hypothetical protein